MTDRKKPGVAFWATVALSDLRILRRHPRVSVDGPSARPVVEMCGRDNCCVAPSVIW